MASTPTIASTYDADLAAANQLLAERLAAAIAGGDAILAEHLPQWLDDELNNNWIEGLTIAQWAEIAAGKVGI